MNPIALGVSAVVVNLVTSLLKSVGWSRQVKHIVATVVATIVAGVTLFLSGGFGGEDLAQSVLAVHGGAQALYNLFFKDTTLNEKLETTLVA